MERLRERQKDWDWACLRGHYAFILHIWDTQYCIANIVCTTYNILLHVHHQWPSLHVSACTTKYYECVCIDICACRGVNELSCFDTTTDPVLAGRMTTLIEWLPEYSNEVILPHQMMKNSCYKLVLVQTALRNFICYLIFLLASSAGTIVWLEEREKKHT